jgi:cysteinyl-tRNA synthetase
MPGCQNRDYRQDMRQFVQDISLYAKGHRPDFIVIPQNGEELATDDGLETGPVRPEYLNAIDGMGREDLFYGYLKDNEPTPFSETSRMTSLLDLAADSGIKILVSDYCWTPSFVDSAYSQNESRGYLSFAADHRELDNVPVYPGDPFHANDMDITALAEAKNFLYLINPGLFPDKESFLTALGETDHDIVILDLFYNDVTLSSGEVAALKTKKNGGDRLVIAYMSIGEAENYRYYWKPGWALIPPPWLLGENPNWSGNFKVRYWEADWQRIIFGADDSYLKKILDAGFDGVYLDLVDAYEHFE